MANKRQSKGNQSRRPRVSSKRPRNETQNSLEPPTESVVPAPPPDDSEAQQRSSALPFPIVGVGASAGGLEAFTQFLQALSPDMGMAIVFVQHLSPEHASLLVELLSRVTTLRVATIAEGMAAAPNRVYIMPPHKYLTMTQA